MTITDRTHSLTGLARLMTLAFDGVDLAPLAACFIERAAANSADAEALMDLSTVLQLQGHREIGLATQAEALATRRDYELPAANTPALRLLSVMLPGDLMTNTPLEFLLADSDVTLTQLYLAADEPMPTELPPHDVVFIAASQSERAAPLHHALAAAIATWPKHVINAPSRIPDTSRTRAFRVLDGAPGIAMPATARLSRAELLRVADGSCSIDAFLIDGAWPLIIRPVDSHAGSGLEKLDAPAAVSRYLNSSVDDAFFVSRFVDYRDADGQFRKYRVVLIDGVAYPGHMGVSSHWMVHYLNAGMTESGAKRAEEERFMSAFKADFGARHATAFSAMAARFGLEYLVVDCAETATGELLVFEVCTGAVLHAMDPVDLFPYKRRPMNEVFQAFRALLAKHAAPTRTVVDAEAVPVHGN